MINIGFELNLMFKQLLTFIFVVWLVNLLVFLALRDENNSYNFGIIDGSFFKKFTFVSSCLFSVAFSSYFLFIKAKLGNLSPDESIFDPSFFSSNNNFVFAYYIFLKDFKITFVLNEYNLNFIMLFSILFPIIFSLFTIDFGEHGSSIYMHMLSVFFFSYLLLLTENIVLLYVLYELIVVLLLYIMYQSSSSRGSVEAMLYFLGWAILGSILIGIGFLSTYMITNEQQFFLIKFSKYSENEMYWIYLLFYIGFGIKLSLWPFWYWLPKAHVEVSTSLSVFLSCVLIKISLYCLFKTQSIFLTDCDFKMFIILPVIGVLDVVFRIIAIRDLKAIVAYSSVLHTNWLIILIHFDSLNNIKYISYYIWGHSILTTIFFLLINIIENNYGSRSVSYITGINMSSTRLRNMILLALVPIFEIPISIFFWGEFWSWLALFDKVPATAFELIFSICIAFNCIFVTFWLNIIFGIPDESFKKPNIYEINQELFIIYLFLIAIMLVIGVCPGYISNFSMNVIF